jgi:3-oxoacyl-[acyl-carrier protein] reductase
MSELKGKVAIVTGASRGIGAAVAEALAAAGVKVMLAARDGARAAELAGRLGGAAMGCDVADSAAVEHLVAATERQLGPVELLVNNAGVIEPIGMLADSDPQAWARNIAINLTGAYHVIRAVLPRMIAHGRGSIVNVSSGAAHRPLEGWSAYCAGKAGLAMVTRSIALETEGKGIRVYGFAPGTVDTDMQVQIRASGINRVSQIPRGSLAPVAAPAKAIVYLCTDAAADLSGQEVSLPNDEAFRCRLGL